MSPGFQILKISHLLVCGQGKREGESHSSRWGTMNETLPAEGSSQKIAELNTVLTGVD